MPCPWDAIISARVCSAHALMSNPFSSGQGNKLSSLAQPSLVGGTPTTTPALGTCYFDPSTNDLWIYADAGWKSVTLT
jgi:hypothetical protein